MAMRAMVRSEFKKSMNETNPEKIEELKFNAVRALSNYSLYNAASKDPQMKARMKKRQETLDAEQKKVK
ncbi:Hypothetical Protein FCC1311_011482 [Hondaea fermentalgiana]|uniref:Uncharacterized protein n=1 Tax=Hondaea fermentalgiana TaxID=2315210 RepID=A0A2R5GA14_9STRA|nr:Hypothetical Protein FCC1311_011482 [Hondaea fermentalgiana]|eukprot:GBG24931.1 Hypothetical Protein FCC1311_011482 [Hondaea fermentalgiana]